MASQSSRLPSHESVANPLAFENIPPQPPSPRNSQSHYIGSNPTLGNNFDLNNHQDLHESYMQLLNDHMQLLAINGAGATSQQNPGGTMLMRPSNPLRRRRRISIPLQDLMEEGNPQQIEFILREVEGHLHDLMMDHDGNHLVQKIFQAISVVQMDGILNLIIRDENKFMNVCINYHG